MANKQNFINHLFSFLNPEPFNCSVAPMIYVNLVDLIKEKTDIQKGYLPDMILTVVSSSQNGHPKTSVRSNDERQDYKRTSK